MDPADAFAASSLFKWDPRAPPLPPPPPPSSSSPHEQLACRELTDVFQGYGVRYLTAARIGELGFTPSTLVGMRDEELDDMMSAVAHLFRWDLLVGERYGIKAAVRAERRRLESVSGFFNGDDRRRRSLLLSPDHPAAMDALSQEGAHGRMFYYIWLEYASKDFFIPPHIGKLFSFSL